MMQLMDYSNHTSLNITIKWIDKNNDPHCEIYSDIDEAMTILELLNGDITEEDLKP